MDRVEGVFIRPASREASIVSSPFAQCGLLSKLKMCFQTSKASHLS